MTGKTGMPFALSEKEMQEAVDALIKHGSFLRAAKAIGLSRPAFHNRIDQARKAGLTDIVRSGPNPPRWRPFPEVVAAQMDQFDRVRAAGDGRTLHTRHLADNGPFALFVLGDPHLDAPGTDLRLWERWCNHLNAARHVHALFLGDWLDNWVGKLQFLYGATDIPAPEGWILLKGYLERYGPHALGSCSGNHDDWSGYTDLLGHLMAEQGVLHRAVSLRLDLRTPSDRSITIGMRHRFPGSSQWNPAHAVMKAAELGWRDTILVGGDKHISGDGLVRCPDTGKLTWCYQVAAFKVIDDYGDLLGLANKHVSPAVAFVIDPSREANDPSLVQPFHDPEAAVEYLKFLRRKK